MKLSRKYLLAEMSGPFLLGFGAFTLVVLLHRFSRLADMVIARDVPLRLVGRLLLALFPPFYEITLPASFLLAVLLALGRLSASGLGKRTALSPLIRGRGRWGCSISRPVPDRGGIVCSASLLVAWKASRGGTGKRSTSSPGSSPSAPGRGSRNTGSGRSPPTSLVYPDRVSPTAEVDGVFSPSAPREESRSSCSPEGRFLQRR
jgi:hypothetical protein